MTLPEAAIRRLALWLIVATALTGTIGLLLQDRIENLFKSTEITAVLLLVTGLLLFLSDRVKSNSRDKVQMNLKDAAVGGAILAVRAIG